MSDSIAGTYANLAGIEIVNDARTLAYLKNSESGSIQVYGDCGCANLFDVIGCFPPLVELDQYVDLPGLSGNYISTTDTAANSLQGTAFALQLNGSGSGIVNTPDNAVLDITGDIDIRIWLKPDVWNIPGPGGGLNLIQKNAGAPQRSWRIQINNLGRPSLELSTDGTNFVSATASTGITIPNGIAGWIRATWRQSDGRVQFFTATDSPTPIWTQLGADQTIAIASIFNSTAVVDILASANSSAFKVVVYKLEILNGINGTAVANPDFTKSPWAIGDIAGTARADSAGRTWSLSNQAEIVAQAERRSLRLSGASGVCASTPDSAALDIVSDIDLRWYGALDDWTPSSPNTLISKFDGATNQRSYIFRVNTGGNLQLILSVDGIATVAAASSVVNTITDGALSWVRATWANATDQANFYTSTDGVTWTLLGAANVALVATGIFSSTARLNVGAEDNGGTGNRLTGNVFAAEVRNGIGGTIVANPVFTARPWDVGETGGAIGADAAGNTWTLNGAGAVIQKAFASDLDIRVKVALDDWTPAAINILIDKRNPAGYQFRVETTGILTLVMSTNGVVNQFINGVTPVGAANGLTKWVRVTFSPSTGIGTFYTSDDGVSWSLLTTSTSATSRWAILDNIQEVRIGQDSGGTGNLAGNVYYAEVRNGIQESLTGSTIVASFDANDTLATSATTPNTVTSSRSGEVWTINGSGWMWGNGAYTYPNYPYTAYPGYVDPATDNAPWYTADIPASGEFLGFVVDEFEGLNSPFKRSVTQSIGNGGVLSRSRLGTRELTWRGFLFGSSCCGTQYGLRWLTKTLSRIGVGCQDCLGDDLELLVCCPDDAVAATGTNSPFRTLKGVGLLEGPEILSQRKTCSAGCTSGCGGSCILEIEFTLVATQPYFYSDAIPVIDCANIYTGSVQPPYTDIDAECPPFNCVVDACAPVLPPTATYQNDCIGPFVTPRANYYTVPRNVWNEFDEVVPVISITASELGLNHISLGFYSSQSGDPCGDLSTSPPECDIICDAIEIVRIPALSTFYIDGRTRKMSVICFDGTAFAGERITSGPWSWPSFNCLGFCMEIKFENDPPNLDEKQACVSLSLVPRTY